MRLTRHLEFAIFKRLLGEGEGKLPAGMILKALIPCMYFRK
jgi:hypothetical protein